MVENNVSMMICDYDEWHHDCQEESLGTSSGKCMFHDKTFLGKDPNNTKKVQKRLYEKLNEVIHTEKNHEKKRLECIEYILPDIEFHDIVSMSVVFEQCVFKEKVNFSGTVFEGETYFLRSTFKEKVNFSGTVFNEKTDFEGAVFEGAVYCSETVFGEVNFSRTVFGEVNFLRSSFEGETYFIETIFYGTTNFAYVKFTGEILFRSTRFNKIGIFKHTVFDENAKITFDCNMNKISFVLTKIPQNIKFGPRVKWKKGNKIFIDSILDDISQERVEFKRDVLLEDILAVYQDLRENYEYHFNYDGAGKFFVRESEVKRQYEDVVIKKASEEEEFIIKKKGWLRRNISFARIYQLISDYGESYTRPLVIVGTIFLGSAIYFTTLFPNVNNLQGFDLAMSSITYAMKRSISAIVPYIDLEDDAAQIDYFIKAISLPLVGVSFIGMKRRFE